jgi:uncharacterized peroxidase-related enzyme
MAYVAVDPSTPGIRALMDFKPQTGRALSALAEALLRGESSLSRGERELIAAFVSSLNECRFCTRSHAAFAAAQLDGDARTVDAVLADLGAAPIAPKLRALLGIAEAVQLGGLHVTDDLVARARAEGADDGEIHDTVLIAAAFCMFNRYVDGLRASTPEDPAAYARMAALVVAEGYVR